MLAMMISVMYVIFPHLIPIPLLLTHCASNLVNVAWKISAQEAARVLSQIMLVVSNVKILVIPSRQLVREI
jgi:hypothetical protein